MTAKIRDHGGGIDAASARYGGSLDRWIDMSTGINPVPYPVPPVSLNTWCALPDRTAQNALVAAARAFWEVPDGAEVLAVPGASAAIARLPALAQPARVRIPGPTYNEHAAAFSAHGWEVVEEGAAAACVLVHPNNPTGHLWTAGDLDTPMTIIDESFCDTCPAASLTHLAAKPGVIVLKSFGKFWGLAGLRLGFVVAAPDTISDLSERIGPWAVSGPALQIGTEALRDRSWADDTRKRLATQARQMDDRLRRAGAEVLGGTTLFRLYHVEDAQAWQTRLAKHHIWSRTFPYNPHFLRLGLPPPKGWDRLDNAL